MLLENYWMRARRKGYTVGAQYLYRRPLEIRAATPLISFTFDDFPKSALRTAGEILHSFGFAGTYYTSLGLMGKEEPSGPMFTCEDLPVLLKQEHELGCHTYHHCHSWRTTPAVFEKSIMENQRALNVMHPEAVFTTFSYPICTPRPQTKHRVAKYYSCARGGGQTFNIGTVDLNNLSAYFLEKSRNNPEAVKEMIDQNSQARGWLIFATHDVCDNPTPYGCTPGFFEDVVRWASASGATILPVARALRSLSENR